MLYVLYSLITVEFAVLSLLAEVILECVFFSLTM